MKLPCQIVQDLLPLYEDQVCSPSSREAVEAHLKQCQDCRGLLRRTQEWTLPEAPVEISLEEQAVTRSFRKVRRRWRLSLLAVLMVIPLALLAFMGYNQHRGEGVCFTNLDEIWVGLRFADALEAEDYEKAASYLDVEEKYQEVQTLLTLTPEDCRPKFTELTMGDETWVARPEFLDRYLRDAQDPLDVWMYLIYNGMDWVLIPEDIFLEIASTDSLPEEGRELYEVYEHRFCRLETRWGTFMVTLNTWESLMLADTEETDYVYTLELLPEAMYRELEPQIEADALAEYQRIQKLCEPVAHMDRAAFDTYLREKYAAQLEALKDCSIRSTGYQTAYRAGDHWVVAVGIQITGPDGTQTAWLDLSARGGTITLVSSHYRGEFDDGLDSLLEVLYPRWS